MKYFVIFLILIATVMVTVNPISAQCAYDPSQPHKPCDDTHEFLILDSFQTQIENINGVWYYVSEPLMSNLSVDKIVFHDVSFTLPYRNDPPRYTYSDVEFSDGIKETLSVLFDEPSFTEHVSPQAGFVGKTNGYSFLVSADLKELSPLKQFKSRIAIDQIQCKEGFAVAIKKSNGNPACVKPETKTKLIERGWATADQLENKIITPEDNDKLIDIKKGESFIVKLDSSYDWRISIDNQTVIDSDYSDIRYSGSQGVYRALNSGQAILTGVGDPLCLSLDPPCMSPSILFQLNINVK